LEARATKTPAQAKKREKKHLTPAGLNADKLPPDSLTLLNFARLELFKRHYRRTTMKPSVPAASSPGISFCSFFGKGVKKTPFLANRLRRFFCAGVSRFGDPFVWLL
jgi:hypothetical protein